MKNLLIATENPAKLQEIRRFLMDLPVELVGLKDLGIFDVVEETGKTFEENAILKATFYSEKSGLPTVADDGGIEIDILGGEPGVQSRRWAGPENNEVHDLESDERLIQYALTRMKDFPEAKRGAQMRTVVAFSSPQGRVSTGEGTIRGIIAIRPSEKRYLGFPFRSLFFLPEIRKFYNHDELTEEENERYNHRKKALEKIKPIIRETILHYARH
ncbi:MAG: non-canonical purine NTP pyrophosphatase [bacterium]|nr:non-canonical purine NTP pyrophosphatase [bacterium]